jgi:MFS family permease
MEGAQLTPVYAYQGAITAVLFNGRTRALVSLLTGLGSLSGAIVLGFLTDRLPFGRRKRAMCACLFVLVINCIIWGAGLGFQVQFDRASVEADEVLLGAATPWDFEQSSSAGGPISLLMFCTSTSQVNGAEADMKITLEMRLIRDLLTIL